MHSFALIPLVTAIGYPGIFATVFLESGVFFGFFLPGASMLFTAGLLASQGLFNVWLLMPLVALAAVLGDNVGYWFGAKVGPLLYSRPNSRLFRREHMHEAKAFYEHHGAIAIFLARFVPVIRTFTPIVAGAAGMRYSLFFRYNLLGALVWGAGVTFAGYYLGEKIPWIAGYITPIVVIIIIATLIPIAWKVLKGKKIEEV